MLHISTWRYEAQAYLLLLSHPLSLTVYMVRHFIRHRQYSLTANNLDLDLVQEIITTERGERRKERIQTT